MDTKDNDPTEPRQPDEGAADPGPQSPAPEGPDPGTQPASEPAAGEQTAREQAAGNAGAGAARARRLTRSSDNRVIAGVCGGIARYLDVDATLVRIGAVAITLFGGAGVLLYLAALVLMPVDSGAADPGSAATSDRARAGLAIGVILLFLFGWPFLLGGGFLLAGLVVPLAVLAVMGLLTWWLVSGEGPSGSGGDVARRAALGIGVLLLCGLVAVGGAAAAGLGGGTAVALLIIGAGVALVAGAFVGGARWLILPALSLALAVGFVSAAGIDFDGGVGEREYKPASASALRDSYEIGMGELVVDLRDAKLPAGDTRLQLDVGLGEAQLIVPEDVCVASIAEVGIGAVDVFDRENGGVDLDWEDRPRAAAGKSRVIVDADVGVGALRVGHDRSEDFDDGPRFGRRFRGDDDEGDEVGNVGCGETRAAR